MSALWTQSRSQSNNLQVRCTRQTLQYPQIVFYFLNYLITEFNTVFCNVFIAADIHADLPLEG